MIRFKRSAVATAALGLALVVAPATAQTVLAGPAAAGGGPPYGHIDNHTGRTLVGAKIVKKSDWTGKHRCTIWNWGEDGKPNLHKNTYCNIKYIKPHTRTATFEDFDAVTVRSSGYYWARFGSGAYHKVLAGRYTKFSGFRTAHCYSGSHVKCTQSLS